MVVLNLARIQFHARATSPQALISLPLPRYRQHTCIRPDQCRRSKHAIDIQIGQKRERGPVWAFVNDSGNVDCFTDLPDICGCEVSATDPLWWTLDEPFCHVMRFALSDNVMMDALVRYFELVAMDEIRGLGGKAWRVIEGSDLPYAFMQVFQQACETVHKVTARHEERLANASLELIADSPTHTVESCAALGDLDARTAMEDEQEIRDLEAIVKLVDLRICDLEEELGREKTKRQDEYRRHCALREKRKAANKRQDGLEQKVLALEGQMEAAESTIKLLQSMLDKEKEEHQELLERYRDVMKQKWAAVIESWELHNKLESKAQNPAVHLKDPSTHIAATHVNEGDTQELKLTRTEIFCMIRTLERSILRVRAHLRDVWQQLRQERFHSQVLQDERDAAVEIVERLRAELGAQRAQFIAIIERQRKIGIQFDDTRKPKRWGSFGGLIGRRGFRRRDPVVGDIYI